MKVKYQSSQNSIKIYIELIKAGTNVFYNYCFRFSSRKIHTPNYHRNLFDKLGTNQHNDHTKIVTKAQITD